MKSLSILLLITGFDPSIGVGNTLGIFAFRVAFLLFQNIQVKIVNVHLTVRMISIWILNF